MSRLLLRARAELTFALVIALTLLAIDRFTVSTEQVRPAGPTRHEHAASPAADPEAPLEQPTPPPRVEPSREPPIASPNIEPQPAPAARRATPPEPDSAYTRLAGQRSHGFRL